MDILHMKRDLYTYKIYTSYKIDIQNKQIKLVRAPERGQQQIPQGNRA